ncbi:MAG: PD40 domain-containing protein [Candidatus Krumholzibacteriota bacterium]|nr:PD40 domain-containing protein [Candidatus Krumholzibacteriota bacterium]
MRRVRVILYFITVLAILNPAPSNAQYPFGKNKVQYYPKGWRVIETEHMDIYYYPDELAIAEFIAGMAEEVYEEYSAFFDLEIERRVPIILYGTHHDFKETNIIPYTISEGTGGFTEFIKGRVAIPFMGSYGKLKRVFRHEMVHVFMLEKLRVVMHRQRRYTYMHPPLWFTEGLAEFLALRGMDSEAEMFMRDAVITDRLYYLDDLWRIMGTYMMYKHGESVLHYIATRFGDDAIRMIHENWWKSDKFDLILLSTIGIGQNRLDRDYREYLKKRYYPSVMTRRQAFEILERLSPEERSFENHPASIRGSDSKDRTFCTGFGLGSIDIFELEKDKRGRQKKRTIIEGGRSDRFESIPLLRSRISSRNDTLVFVSKSGKRDVIYLYRADEEKIISSVRCDEVRMINSPVISRDGKSVVFSALDNKGKTDLYIKDLDDGTLERITDDYYEDLSPDWHPDGKTIIFSSDRTGGEPGDEKAIFSIDLATRRITRLTAGHQRDIDPRYMPDGNGILFSSDRDGVFDIYLQKDGVLYRQTNLLGGAFEPVPEYDGDTFLLSAYSEGAYHVYRKIIEYDNIVSARNMPGKIDISWDPRPSDSTSVYLNKDYNLRFGLDLIAAAFSVDPDYGYMGNGAQIFLTDVMSDHHLVFLFGSASDDFSDFWDNANLGFTYINEKERLNYAFGAFHLAGYIGSVHGLIRFERRYGVMAGLSYPISRFRRVDFQTIFKYMERDDDITYLGTQVGKTTLVSNHLSFTSDNIVWTVGGPLNGHRMNISLGRSFDINGSRYESTTFQFDLRHYINFGPRFVFAQRLVTRKAWGSDIQLFYLGGAWDLRGYDFRQYAGKAIFLLNSEFRFPLVDDLLIRFPFGHIEFPVFRGSVFVDAGKVDGFIYDTGWIGSIGTGVEMNLGYLPVIRVNFVRKTDFKTIAADTNFDFFIGFNF